MRQLGTIQTEKDAFTFSDYLMSQQIENRLDSVEEGWEIWIINEDQLEAARKEWDSFQEDPGQERFQSGAEEAVRKKKEQFLEQVEAARQRMQSQRSEQGQTLYSLPVTTLLIVLSVFFTLAIQFQNEEGGLNPELTIVRFRPIGNDMVSWQRGLQEICQGEVWRLVTPIFMHLSPFHLLFNMYWTYLLGVMIEPKLKLWRYALLVVVVAMISNLSEYYYNVPQMEWKESPLFGGMSGVVYGLFGFIVVKQKLEPNMSLMLPDFTIFLMIGWLFLCMTGAVGPVANMAHVSGFLVGAAVAAIRPGLKLLAISR